ncbi:MAG: hypothetical protein RQ875_10045 [Vicingaceae bacterium]|nr:hypothetical protein [Vicingaceae bacterium]
MYFKTNNEDITIKSNLNENKFKFLRLERYEQILGYKVDKDRRAIKIGIIAFGSSNIIKKSLSSDHFSKEKISAQSFGFESSYMFKLTNQKKETSILFGINVDFQYIFIKRSLYDSYTYKEETEENESFNSIVLGPAVGVFIQKKITKKFVLDLGLNHRFFTPISKTPILFTRNSIVAAFSINYILN